MFAVTDGNDDAHATWGLIRNGEVVKLAGRGRASSRDVSWQIFELQAPPGTYTLRNLDKPEREMAVHVQSQRCTRVIFGDLNPRYFSPVRILVGPFDAPAIVDPARFETLEWALALLQGERNHVPARVIEAVHQPASIDDPMLGLVAAYLQARENEPNPDIIEAHVQRIETWLGVCPDTQALRIRAALIRGREISLRGCTDPPMLREGLLAFVEASHVIPEVIAAGSLLERACIERLVDMPLATWSPGAVPDPDWLREAAQELKRETVSRGKEVHPREMARELGVPTLAVMRSICS